MHIGSNGCQALIMKILLSFIIVDKQKRVLVTGVIYGRRRELSIITQMQVTWT
jgi:hypothetical protein